MCPYLPVRVKLHGFRVFVDMPVLHHTGLCFAPLDQGIDMLILLFQARNSNAPVRTLYFKQHCEIPVRSCC